MKETCAGGGVAAHGGCQNQAKAWVRAEKPLKEVMDRWGPQDSTIRKAERMGKWLMLEGGRYPDCVHTQNPSSLWHLRAFISAVPPKEGVFHILSFTLHPSSFIQDSHESIGTGRKLIRS